MGSESRGPPTLYVLGNCVLLPRLVRDRAAQSAGEVHQAPPFMKMTQLEFLLAEDAGRKYNPGGEPSRHTAPRLEASAASRMVRGNGGDEADVVAIVPNSSADIIPAI